MTFGDIIILGPTSSGKSDLANAIASTCSIPVFNCDAIQVYKDLNSLTNKPIFENQFQENGEVLSFTKDSLLNNLDKWKDFSFIVITKNGNSLENNTFDNDEFYNFLLKEDLLVNTDSYLNSRVKNYLFDIREPMQNYSLIEFREDIKRISIKNKFDRKIIVGGTIYYAYHYIFGTKFQKEFESHVNVNEVRENVSEIDLDLLIRELEEKDPESLKLIDLKNKQRVAKAVEYIRRTGGKFSKNYFKKINILDNFLLIMIIPKDKDIYYKRLDSIVENRINSNSLKEIEFLISKYDEGVKEWLRDLSYEYKFALDLLDFEEKHPPESSFEGGLKQTFCRSIICDLKLAERHYAKRQMTFLKKLGKDLKGV